MASAMWSRRVVCLPPNSWPSGCVLTMDVPMKLIWSFPKRSRDYALRSEKTAVVYAFRAEMALTLEDVLARRTRLLLEDRARSDLLAAEVAILMERELDWSIEHMH